MIPIYLIVAGSVGLVSNIISIIKSAMTKKQEQTQEENSEEKKSAVGVEQLFNTFLFAWSIAGKLICNCNHGYVSLENWNFMFYIIWMRFLLLVE